MDKNKKYKFDTMAIHAGVEGKNPYNALNTPIYQTSTFVFDNTEQVRRIMSFEESAYVYTRGGNPTVNLFEDRMAALEGGNGAVAFSSGMAAISSVLLSLLEPGDEIIAHKTLYGSTYNVVTHILPKYNIEYKMLDLANDLEMLNDIISEKTKVIFFETPSNPSLAIIDIKKVSEIAKKYNIKVVVDNTFATPYVQKPLMLGADIVVHSTTKYINGHGDAVGGVAIAKEIDYVQKLKFGYMCEFGGVMSPFDAWLFLRGLKTLGLRMRQHQENAKEVAKYLESHPKIKEVMYPGLESFKGHKLAKEQMNGFGAVISFEVDGDIEDAKKVVNNVKLAQLAVSLGDCETLIELPAAMTHLGYPRQELEKYGLTESLVRISVGLEDASDIIEDLDNVLKLV